MLDWFTVARAPDQVMSKLQTSSSSAEDSTLADVVKLLVDWPGSASGLDSENARLEIKPAWATWQDDLNSLGLDKVAVLRRFESHQARLAQFEEKRTASNKSKILKAYAQASEKCAGLSELLHESESLFMQRMAERATALAKLQGQLVLDQTSPSVFGQGPTQPSASDLAALASKIQYVVTVYTAITFFRLPATWKPNCKKAEKNQESLRLALQSLTENDEVARVELDSAHKIVAQMRQDLKLEGPKRQQGHSVSTSSDSDFPKASGQVTTASASGQGAGATVERSCEEANVKTHVGTDPETIGGNSMSNSSPNCEPSKTTVPATANMGAAVDDKNKSKEKFKSKGKGKSKQKASAASLFAAVCGEARAPR